MSLRFLFLLNANIGGSAKISFNFGSICKICQFLSITVLRSGRVLLFKLGITPCKAEQPLKGMGLQEKETQTD